MPTPEEWADTAAYHIDRDTRPTVKSVVKSVVASAVAEERARCAAAVRDHIRRLGVLSERAGPDATGTPARDVAARVLELVLAAIENPPPASSPAAG